METKTINVWEKSVRHLIEMGWACLKNGSLMMIEGHYKGHKINVLR